MQPTSLFSFPASPVFLRRLVILLLSSTLVLFLAGSALAQIDTPRPIVADAFSAGAWEPNELPDVAVVLSGVPADDPALEQVVIPSLRDLPGVVGVVGEVAPSGRVALHVSLDSDVSDTVLPMIAETVEEGLPNAQVSLGGRAVADRDLLDRLNRGMIVAVVPVVVLLTVLISAGLGVRFGLAAGGTVGLSALLGGLIGASVAGPFDGSLATTAVPAVLVAVLVSSVLSFRLLDWFKQPIAGDQAEAIRESVRHILPESALLFGGLIVTAIVLELAGGSTPTSVVAIGGLFAGLVTLGALPALLATMGAVPDEEEFKLFRLNGPDGRDFPLAVLAGFACFLLGLGLFAIRVPDSTLMDESSLPQGVTSRRVSEQLIELGGDPSSALLAEISVSDSGEPIDERSLADWSIAVSELPTVGWVETATGRYAGGALVSAPVSSANFDADGSTLAIVTPTITPRSAAAQSLVGELDIVSTSMLANETTFSGSAVDAAQAIDGGSLRLWLLVALLSIAGALAVLLLVNDLMLAALTLGLRLLGTVALLGVYHLVAGDVGAVELQVAALIFSVGVGLFEIGFLRRIRDDVAASLDDVREGTDVVNAAFRREGRAAMLGLAVTALCGLGLLVNDLTVARQLGVVVAAGVVIELLIGTWLLRPAVLGERAVSVALGGTLLDRRAFNGDRELRGAPTGDPVSAPAADAGQPVLPEKVLTEGVPNQDVPESEPAFARFVAAARSSVAATASSLSAGIASLLAAAAPKASDDPAGSDGSAGAAADGTGDRTPPPPAGEMIAPPATLEVYLSDTDFGSGASAPTEPPRIVLHNDEPATLEEHPAGAPRVVSSAPPLGSPGDTEWRRIVSNLLRQEFAFQTEPEKAELETVFVDSTPLFGELQEHNRRLRQSGLQVQGDGPILRKVTAVNTGSPVTLAVTVDHPPRQLLDRNGRVLGTRPAERRDGMLWLIQDPSGRYRIAEAVDLGTAATQPTAVDLEEGASRPRSSMIPLIP